MASPATDPEASRKRCRTTSLVGIFASAPGSTAGAAGSSRRGGCIAVHSSPALLPTGSQTSRTKPLKTKKQKTNKGKVNARHSGRRMKALERWIRAW